MIILTYSPKAYMDFIYDVFYPDEWVPIFTDTPEHDEVLVYSFGEESE